MKELTVCKAEKGMRFGTAVTRGILDKLGSPDENLKIIHIAGTNGKGSTAEYFTQILTSAGKKTGTFTSPFAYDYGEQFRINGQPIPTLTREKYFTAALKASEGRATSFETETAGVIYAFFKEGCEYAVIECGMGGLNDATNAVLKKELAVITSVSLEHTAYLGGTVKEICAHKAGIIKDCPAVINSLQPREAEEYFRQTGAVFADGVELVGKKFKYRGKEYELTATGASQPYNAATAVEGARILGIDEKYVREGLKRAKPRGRLETFEAQNRRYILDGAHNPAAFAPLKEVLKGIGEEKTIIFGCLNDKDIEGILKEIAHLAEKVIAVQCPGSRALGLREVESACKKYFNNVTAAESVSEALNSSDTRTTVVCGSFTLLKEALEWIEKRR